MSREDEERLVFEDEGEIAIRIVEWFTLLSKMRSASETVPAEVLIKELSKADAELLHHDYKWLVSFLAQHFMAERKRIDRLVQLDSVRPTAPYTAEMYDEAVSRIRERGEKETKTNIAKVLGVTRKTLSKWGRPA